MVRRLFERITTPIRGLHQAAYWLMLLTLASQVLALLRDRTFAHTFGAGQILDLYYAAFRVPDLVFALVSSLVSAYVLIPRMMGASDDDTRTLLSESISFLVIGAGALCLVLGIFAHQLLFLIYPEFAHLPYAAEFVLLARILLVQPIILGISGIVTTTSQVHHRFVLFALSPVLYNLGIILGTVVLYPLWGLPGIGIGVLVGAVANVIIHIPMLIHLNVMPRFKWPTLATMLPVMRDSIPRSLALGMSSITALTLTAIAARFASGSISIFTLALNLEAVPLSLIGGTYAVAAFPALSASAGKDPGRFTGVLSSAARQIILWSIACIGLIVVLRAYIVRVILGSGAFDWNATRLTAALLAIFAVGLVAQGLILLFSRALYAAKQSWRPLLYQVGGFVITIASAIGLILYSRAAPGVLDALGTLFRLSGVSDTIILLLAAASTIGQIALAIASVIALRSVAPGLAKTLTRPLYEGALAALAGGAAAYAVLYFAGGIEPLTTLVAVFTHGLAAGMVGVIAVLAVLALLKNEEFGEIAAAVHRRVSPSAVLAPSAEEPVQP
jgi:putative peptidoglycan lipid II flippase